MIQIPLNRSSDPGVTPLIFRLASHQNLTSGLYLEETDVHCHDRNPGFVQIWEIDGKGTLVKYEDRKPIPDQSANLRPHFKTLSNSHAIGNEITLLPRFTWSHLSILWILQDRQIGSSKRNKTPFYILGSHLQDSISGLEAVKIYPRHNTGSLREIEFIECGLSIWIVGPHKWLRLKTYLLLSILDKLWQRLTYRPTAPAHSFCGSVSLTMLRGAFRYLIVWPIDHQCTVWRSAPSLSYNTNLRDSARHCCR